jgi:hypothetical protein
MGDGVLQFARIDTAGDHDGRRFLIVDKREQQMLERGIFVLASGSGSKRVVKRSF